MEYQQYTTYSFWESLLNALKLAIALAPIIALPAFIVFLFKKTPLTRTALINSLVAGAFIGALIGGFVPSFMAQDGNKRVLAENISKKYEYTQVVKHELRTRSDPYSPTSKEMHGVTILVNGESRLAYLQQDEKTNEPTLFNYDTKQPLTDILKEK